jgi:hypothetical protein
MEQWKEPGAAVYNKHLRSHQTTEKRSLKEKCEKNKQNQ